MTFLYRHEYYYPDSPLDDFLVEKGANAEFSFAKYREGSLETIGIHFNGNKVKYSDPQEYDEYPNDIPKMNPNDDENFYDA